MSTRYGSIRVIEVAGADSIDIQRCDVAQGVEIPREDFMAMVRDWQGEAHEAVVERGERTVEEQLRVELAGTRRAVDRLVAQRRGLIKSRDQYRAEANHATARLMALQRVRDRDTDR